MVEESVESVEKGEGKVGGENSNIRERRESRRPAALKRSRIFRRMRVCLIDMFLGESPFLSTLSKRKQN